MEPIANHAHYAIQNCEGDKDKLRASLLNVVSHYKDDHSACSLKSRCRTDSNYEPSRIILTSKKTEDLLTSVITKSTLYTAAADFVLGRSTSHVESFNNTMNMFHDKRIYYSDIEYNTRLQIAAMHWNENVGRTYTSIWTPKCTSCVYNRRQKCRKTYKNATYNYREVRDSIWNAQIGKLYNIQ